MARSSTRPQPWCRFGSWGIGRYPPGYVQAEKTVVGHDLIWIIEGCPTYWIDDRELRAEAPCVLLVLPGSRMRIRWDPRRTSRNCYIYFTPRSPLPHVPDPRTWPRSTHLPDDDVVRPALRHVAGLLGGRPAGWEALAAAALGHALGALCAGTLRGAAVAGSTVGPVGQAVVGHLARIWQPGGTLRTPSLAELAAIHGVSRERFCRAFRAETGVPPLQAVRQMRLERSARLLVDGGLAVSEIARRCGFDDPFHFSRAFGSAYGCVPSRFRTAFAAGRTALFLDGSEALVAFRCELASALHWHD